jgi:hypothetical protein
MKFFSLLNLKHFTHENAPYDYRGDFSESVPSDANLLEEHSLFVLHPMWTDKGDLL